MNDSKKNCLICKRIELIKQGKNPYFIKEFETGYAVLGDYQFFKGYSLLLCKLHKTDLHQLDKEFRQKFLEEMSILAEAVYKTFKPQKLNYELLGNKHCHMHWHIFPRYKSEILLNQPIWLVHREIREAQKYIPDDKIKKKLISEIKKNINVT